MLFKRHQDDAEDIRLNTHVADACKAEIGSQCGNKEFGEGRMVKCLWENIDKTDFSTTCRERVIALTKLSESDYRLDFRIRSRCATAIEAFCSEERKRVDALPVADLFGDGWQAGQSGEVIRCLKRNYTQVQEQACKAEVQRVVRIHSADANMSPFYRRKCKADMEEYCKDVEKGKVHQCLRKHIAELSEECKKEALLQGSLESRNIAMNSKLLKQCKSAVSKYCADVQHGEAQTIQCLQQHMGEEEFPAKCKETLEADIEANNHDWRLKYGIHHACKPTVGKLCATEATRGGGQVLACLKAKRAEVTDGPCKTEVERYIKQGANNIKASPDTYDACIEDVQTLCGQVRPGRGRVHACLLEHIASISAPCQQAEFQEQQLIQEDIRRSPRAYKACRSSWKKLCPDSTAGLGARWKCLEDKKNDPGMAAACVAVVTANERLKNSNFHLNPNLAMDCDAEAQRLCTVEFVLAEYKDFSSEGSVIGCLIAKRAQIGNERCKKSLLRTRIQRAQDLSLDLPLAKACKSDLQDINECRGLPGDATSVRGARKACLTKHRKDLSTECKAELFKRHQDDAEDIRLNTHVADGCKAEISSHCGSKEFGEGRMLKCLWESKDKTDFSETCRTRVNALTRLSESDYRLDFGIRSRCATAIEAFCSEERKRVDALSVADLFGNDWQEGKSGEVIRCLKQLHSDS